MLFWHHFAKSVPNIGGGETIFPPTLSASCHSFSDSSHFGSALWFQTYDYDGDPYELLSERKNAEPEKRKMMRVFIDSSSFYQCLGKWNQSSVAVNHENDTCFENGLVMGYAVCKYYSGLVETPKVVPNVSLACCQTHCKQVPVFSRLSNF